VPCPQQEPVSAGGVKAQLVGPDLPAGGGRHPPETPLTRIGVGGLPPLAGDHPVILYLADGVEPVAPDELNGLPVTGPHLDRLAVDFAQDPLPVAPATRGKTGGSPAKTPLSRTYVPDSSNASRPDSTCLCPATGVQSTGHMESRRFSSPARRPYRKSAAAAAQDRQAEPSSGPISPSKGKWSAKAGLRSSSQMALGSNLAKK